ncbi:hypothetical protein TYRP_009060 [Tyrophagus putrescentiae]|nr:hypothetical protein TYRP_009060 [Tyrophagus putrescentiae]
MTSLVSSAAFQRLCQLHRHLTTFLDQRQTLGVVFPARVGQSLFDFRANSLRLIVQLCLQGSEGSVAGAAAAGVGDVATTVGHLQLSVPSSEHLHQSRPALSGHQNVPHKVPNARLQLCKLRLRFQGGDLSP